MSTAPTKPMEASELLELHASGIRQFPEAYLWGADLGGAHLRDAHLRGANLGGADLGEANLWGANLGGANLRGANLGGANLRGANLCAVDLREADLWVANLREANLEHADLNLGGRTCGARTWGRRTCGMRHRLTGRWQRMAPTPHGYELLALSCRCGLVIRAGCHTFTLAEAIEHWADTPAGNECHGALVGGWYRARLPLLEGWGGDAETDDTHHVTGGTPS